MPDRHPSQKSEGQVSALLTLGKLLPLFHAKGIRGRELGAILLELGLMELRDAPLGRSEIESVIEGARAEVFEHGPRRSALLQNVRPLIGTGDVIRGLYAEGELDLFDFTAVANAILAKRYGLAVQKLAEHGWLVVGAEGRARRAGEHDSGAIRVTLLDLTTLPDGSPCPSESLRLVDARP